MKPVPTHTREPSLANIKYKKYMKYKKFKNAYILGGKILNFFLKTQKVTVLCHFIALPQLGPLRQPTL